MGKVRLPNNSQGCSCRKRKRKHARNSHPALKMEATGTKTMALPPIPSYP